MQISKGCSIEFLSARTMWQLVYKEDFRRTRLMRSCNERTTLHCVSSYLYYIISVKKKIIFGGLKRGRK
jgi:hypothetical protein